MCVIVGDDWIVLCSVVVVFCLSDDSVCLLAVDVCCGFLFCCFSVVRGLCVVCIVTCIVLVCFVGVISDVHDVVLCCMWVIVFFSCCRLFVVCCIAGMGVVSLFGHWLAIVCLFDRVIGLVLLLL